MKLDEIFTFDNLYQSHKHCRKSKQHKGEVIRFELNLAENLYKLIKTITSGQYKFSEYNNFRIFDPKERLIEAPAYKDRVVVDCLVNNSIKPRLAKKLILDNVACQKFKGSAFAIKRLHMFLRQQLRKSKNNDFYFLKLDIRSYFPSIDHHILIWKLKEAGFSKQELKFIWSIIKSGKYANLNCGLPLGNQTSQWFAIYYLDGVDRFIKEKLRVRGYVRYMDDMILIGESKKDLREILEKVEEECRKLKLFLNKKTQIGKVKAGIDFLGFNHRLTPSGKILVRLRQSGKIRMKRKLKALKMLQSKKIVSTSYVNMRKVAFYEHIKRTNEPEKFKNELKSGEI